MSNGRMKLLPSANVNLHHQDNPYHYNTSTTSQSDNLKQFYSNTKDKDGEGNHKEEGKDVMNTIPNKKLPPVNSSLGNKSKIKEGDQGPFFSEGNVASGKRRNSKQMLATQRESYFYLQNMTEITALKQENNTIRFQLEDISRKYRDMSEENKTLFEKMRIAKKNYHELRDRKKESDVFFKKIQGYKEKDANNANLKKFYQIQRNVNSPAENKTMIKNDNDYKEKIEKENEQTKNLEAENKRLKEKVTIVNAQCALKEKEMEKKYNNKALINKEKLNQLTEENTQLKSKLESLKNDKNAKNIDYEQMIKQNNEYKQKLKDNNALIDMYKEDIQGYNTKVDDLENKLAVAEEALNKQPEKNTNDSKSKEDAYKIKSLENEKKKLVAQIASVEQKNNELIEYKDKIDASNKDFQRLINNIQQDNENRVNELIANEQKKQDELYNANKSNENLIHAIKSLEEENTAYMKESTKLNEENKTLKERLEAIEKEHHCLVEDYDNIKKGIQLDQNASSTIEEENKKLMLRIKTIDDDKKHLLDKNSQLEAQIKEYVNLLDLKTKDYDKQNELIKQLNNDIKVNSEKINTLDEEIKKINNVNKELLSNYDKEKKINQQLQKDKVNNEKHRESLLKENQELKQTIEDIQQAKENNPIEKQSNHSPKSIKKELSIDEYKENKQKSKEGLNTSFKMITQNSIEIINQPLLPPLDQLIQEPIVASIPVSLVSQEQLNQLEQDKKDLQDLNNELKDSNILLQNTNAELVKQINIINKSKDKGHKQSSEIIDKDKNYTQGSIEEDVRENNFENSEDEEEVGDSKKENNKELIEQMKQLDKENNKLLSEIYALKKINNSLQFHINKENTNEVEMPQLDNDDNNLQGSLDERDYNITKSIGDEYKGSTKAIIDQIQILQVNKYKLSNEFESLQKMNVELQFQLENIKENNEKEQAMKKEDLNSMINKVKILEEENGKLKSLKYANDNDNKEKTQKEINDLQSQLKISEEDKNNLQALLNEIYEDNERLKRTEVDLLKKVKELQEQKPLPQLNDIINKKEHNQEQEQEDNKKEGKDIEKENQLTLLLVQNNQLTSEKKELTDAMKCLTIELNTIKESSSEYEKENGEHKKQLAIIKSEYQQLNEIYSKADKELQVLKRDNDDLKNEIHQLKESEHQLEELNKQIVSNNEKYKENTGDINKLKEKEAMLMNDIQVIKEENNKLVNLNQKNIAEKDGLVKTIKAMTEDYDEIKIQFQIIQKEYDESKMLIIERNSQLTSLKSKIKELESQLDQLKVREKELLTEQKNKLQVAKSASLSKNSKERLQRIPSKTSQGHEADNEETKEYYENPDEYIILLEEYLKDNETKLNDEMIKSRVLEELAEKEQSKYRSVRDKYNKAKTQIKDLTKQIEQLKEEKTNIIQSDSKFKKQQQQFLEQQEQLHDKQKKTQEEQQTPQSKPAKNQIIFELEGEDGSQRRQRKNTFKADIDDNDNQSDMDHQLSNPRSIPHSGMSNLSISAVPPNDIGNIRKKDEEDVDLEISLNNHPNGNIIDNLKYNNNTSDSTKNQKKINFLVDDHNEHNPGLKSNVKKTNNIFDRQLSDIKAEEKQKKQNDNDSFKNFSIQFFDQKRETAKFPNELSSPNDDHMVVKGFTLKAEPEANFILKHQISEKRGESKESFNEGDQSNEDDDDDDINNNNDESDGEDESSHVSEPKQDKISHNSNIKIHNVYQS